MDDHLIRRRIHMLQIRPITPSDAEAFLQLRTRLDHETRLMMLEPGERSASVSQVRENIEETLASSNSTILVVDDDGKLTGYISAHGEPYARARHSAYIVIGILQEAAGRGLGTRLFSELLAWAPQAGLHRLELTVMTHNQAGIALYKKMGFEIEGTRRHSLRVDGQYVDEYSMALLL